MKTYGILTAAAVGLACTSTAIAKKDLNTAKPEKHPYVKADGGRDAYPMSKEPVNEFRVYDFYERQADYYMGGKTVPSPIPSFPGLDAGKHGHWGKFNQNGHKDGRWNDMDMGTLQEAQFNGALEKRKVGSPDSMAIRLGNNGQVSAVFMPRALGIPLYWQGGMVSYNPFRWGTSRGASPRGKTYMAAHNADLWKADGRWTGHTSDRRKLNGRYNGLYRHGAKIVFSYRVGKTEVLDLPWALDGSAVATRTLQFPGGAKALTHRVLVTAKGAKRTQLADGIVAVRAKGRSWICGLRKSAATASLRLDGEHLQVEIASADKGGRVKLLFWAGPEGEEKAAVDALVGDKEMDTPSDMLDGGAAQWPEVLTTTAQTSADTDAYVVDTIPLPFKNKQNSLMFLSGIDFTADGTAYACTLMGEVWRITGLKKGLGQVAWKRFAKGLNQPFGLQVIDGKVQVLTRQQIVVLEDRNNDGEADFYGNVANDFDGLGSSHSHTFGFDRDAKGDAYFVAAWSIYRSPADGGPAEVVANGVRNCMGFGMLKDGTVLLGPQEGTWTPTSAILQLRAGANYGFKGDAKKPIEPALCYVPRGIDCSTGGMVEADSTRWGPLNERIIGLSYGYGSWYTILRDLSGPTAQGAIVPMPGEFRSGVVRGNFNPVDGQFYTVGLDGWGNYAPDDGCLHRIRYTGKPLHRPTGFKIHLNGIQVDFPVELDAATVAESANYFCQMWNYEYAKQYGSPEFSVRKPESLGHDQLPVTSARVINGGKSIFVEIPDLQPAMQVQLRMHLKSKAGKSFKTDLFPTIHHLGAPFAGDGLAAVKQNKARQLIIRQRGTAVTGATNTTSGKTDAHARRIVVKTIGGMAYDTTTIKAKAGESIALVLQNTDMMPHNLVIVKPDTYEKVGMASFKMLNDPKAADKHYVPESSDVIAYTHVINPKATHTTYFTVPDKPGRYRFFCSFPGHWQLMKGDFIIEGK